MKVAVLEFLCGGGLSPEGDLPLARNCISAVTPLYREGLSMLSALTTDLSQCGHEVHTCLDRNASNDPLARSMSMPSSAIRVHEVENAWMEKWIEIALHCDRTIVIAPELYQQLERTVETLRMAGARVVASSPRFLQTTSDKLATAECFEGAGAWHPTTLSLAEFFAGNTRQSQSLMELPVTLKRRDGAGCSEMKYFTAGQRLFEWLNGPEATELTQDEWIVQRWQPGVAASMALIAAEEEWHIVGAVQQEIALECDADGNGNRYARVSYQGGSGQLHNVSTEQLKSLASKVRDALPSGAVGWIGIDFVVPATHGVEEDPMVIEVNPRLTTSYLGYRQWYGKQLSECILGNARLATDEHGSSRMHSTNQEKCPPLIPIRDDP